MPSYNRYEKPPRWFTSGKMGAAATGRTHFVADRIFDALFTTTLNIRNFHQFVFDDDVVTKEAGGPVNIVLQALKPWPGIAHLKVNINRPFIVILYDEKNLTLKGQIEHAPEYFEVAFFDGNPRQRSILRSDLMPIQDLTGELAATITDLNSDYALENQWTLENLAEEAKKDQSMSDSSLGEWEQGYIIGEALEWTEMEFIPFANWNVLPPFLHDPELQAQCDHEWKEATIPEDEGVKTIWVCKDCDLIVDENPKGEPEEDKDEEDEVVDAAKDELRKKMEKVWEEKEKERKRKKGRSPYDPPEGYPPWDPKKPNPWDPYNPREDGWDKWVKHNPWMEKYCPDCKDDKDKGHYGEAAANA